MNYSKKSPFLKNISRFKARYRKIIRFTQFIVQVGMRCNIGASIEYFAFLNCCNLIFSQIELIIKFLKGFVKKDLNFSQMALCEMQNGFFLVQHKHPQKIMRITCEIFETKYNMSFQVANRTER